jgi:hypothetical protein
MKGRLVRDHENEENKQKSNTPWRPSSSMKRIPLRKWQENWETTRQAVNKEE